MGRRSSSKALVRAEPMYCCFCGGNTFATTIDHVPSVQFFDQKDAAYALRVPSCDSCNARTSASEQVVAFLSRSLRLAATKEDIDKVFKGFCEANPELSLRLLPTANQKKRARREFGSDTVLNMNDDELHSHVQIVGAKWAFALHKEVFGDAIGINGGVWVDFWSNVDRIRGPILPDELELALPRESEHLKMGRKTSIGQFEYAYNIVEGLGYQAALFFVTCSASLAMLLATSSNVTLFSDVEKEGIFIHKPDQPMVIAKPLQLGPFSIKLAAKSLASHPNPIA